MPSFEISDAVAAPLKALGIIKDAADNSQQQTQEQVKTYTKEELDAAIEQAKADVAKETGTGEGGEPQTYTQDQYDKAIEEAKAAAVKEAEEAVKANQGGQRTSPPTSRQTQTQGGQTQQGDVISRMEKGTATKEEVAAAWKDGTIRKNWDRIIA